MYNIKDKEKLEYFKSIVKGHTTDEIINLYHKKYGEKMKSYKVHDLKKRYKLYSGIDTKFKKGEINNKGYNIKPIGSERNKKIKIAPNKWVLKHRYIWEQANGKIPEGKCIIFLDGNKNNFNINNLQLVDKKEELFMAKEGLFFKDKELTKTGVLVAHLKREEKEKMANIWKRLNKLNKSNYEIAKETNIPEEKVEEIMKGERPVPTNMVDDFRKALSTNNKAERSLKLVQTKQWHNRDLAKAVGYKSSSTICDAINLRGGFEVQKNALIRIYKYITEQEEKDKINVFDEKYNYVNPESLAKELDIEELYNPKKEEDIEVLDETPIEEPKYIINSCIEPVKITIEMSEYENLKYQIEELTNRLKISQNQVARYEKLIDMIGL